MTLKSWLQENEFTLALSSGFFGFFCHCGFVKALYEENCIPTRLTGASAGAIIASALATGMNPQQIENLVVSFKKEDFWDPAPGLGLLKGEAFEKIMEKHFIKDLSEAKIPLRISTFDIFKINTRVFTEGPVSKIVRASSTVPLFFHLAKIENRYYWDGGTLDKMAIHGLDRGQRVLSHYLYSSGLWGTVEQKWNERKYVGENLKMVMLKDIPSSGPDLMGRGPEIIEAAYRQTKERLHSKV